MGVEIERKFLIVLNPAFDDLMVALNGTGTAITQGYLSTEPVVRVRRSTPHRWGFLEHSQGEMTVKGKGFITRSEFNIEIDVNVATELLQACMLKIEKDRFRVGQWEIDVFNKGDLYLAEIELPHKDHTFVRPSWIGEEVSENPRYTNVTLAKTFGPR